MGELGINHGLNKSAEGLCVEFMAGDLSLELPFLTINIENPFAKKVFIASVGECSLSIVVEMICEDVSDIGRVGSVYLVVAEGAAKSESQIG